MSCRYKMGVFLLLIPICGFADTTLYVCTHNGETILESTKSEQCDTLKEYHYPSYSHEKSENKSLSSSGLRPEEQRELQAMTSPYDESTLQKRYERVDDRVGWSLANAFTDSIQDKCSFFKAVLNHSLYYIDSKKAQGIDIGPTDTASLQAQVEYAQDEVNYYCKH